MKYFIDFDNTLYETAKLTESMVTRIAELISDSGQYKKEQILEDVKTNFDHTNDNIYSYAEKMAIKYNADINYVVDGVKNVVQNGGKFVFEDAKKFLEKLKEQKQTINLLTYIPNSNQEYQLQKINGSGLSKYFDSIIITSKLKYTLEINYENAIFIDDSPRDLEGLNSMNPLRLIRIRKPNNKRSKIDMEIENMEEYTSFDDISLDFNK